MASNTMNFGPEWMRRFPSKTNSSSASPFLQDDWSQPAPGSTPGNATAGNAGAAAFSYSSVAANNVRSGISSTVPAFETSASDHLPSDTLNPFKYSKELMLSLFKPAGFPIEFERHEYATNEDALMPMSSQPFSDQEIKILSGSVNSEVARRVVQPGEGGQQERGQGQRTEGVSGGDQSGRHDRHDRRHHDAKYQGSGSRTRHLASDDRSHSFKRSEQGSRDKEDGLWNSPGRSTVGSFDANGVFRVTSEQGEALESSDQDEAVLEPRQAQDKGSVLPDTTASDTSAFHNAHQTPSHGLLGNGAEHSDAGPDPETSRSRSLLNEGLDNGDKYVFSNGNTESSSIRDDASFAPFGSSNSSAFNSTPAFNAAPAELSKWLYRDPSGSVQGPFQSVEMHEWYKGGFFSMDLLVKREQDVNFEPLGSLIRRLANEEKPFLLADLQATPLARPTISLPQSRQFSSASWGGLSAPTTPGTPSFGVDRLFQQQQQQQQQQQHTGDMFGNSGGQHHHHQQQQPQQQQPHDAFSGYDQKWNAYGHQQNALDSNAGWAGDAFARSSAMGGLAGPQTPMAGSFVSQQQRLLNQQLERQQYMQLLQRQIQMQHMLHQQQFMAAQQQFGNDPHALAALVAQQQVQQRQLQMRLQQLQHMGFMAGNVSTPGGSAIPSLNGLGQPSSPWSTSIIQSNSDNYFDRAHGENNNVPHSMEQHQEEPHGRQDEQVLQQEQLANHEQPQEHQHQEHALEHSASDSQEQIEAVSDRLEQLEVNDAIEKDEESKHQDNEIWRNQPEAVEQQMPAVENEVTVFEHEAELEEQVQEEAAVEDEHTEEVDETESQPKEQTPAASWDVHVPEASTWGETPESSTWGETPESSTWGATEQPRVIKAVPAPWAKPVGGEEASEKTLSLREIQEIEAKRAEEQRAAERDAQIASGASGILDFGRGLGGTPWQTASAPKKTLRQIQEEEEAAALRKARAAQIAPSASAPPTAPVATVSAGTSIGLAGIVAAGTNSGSKRYADTIGPKPTATAVSSGPWGSSSSLMAAKTAPVTRAPSIPAATSGSVTSSVRATPRVEDNHGWIEVSSQKPSSTTAGTVAEPTPTRTTPLVQKKTSSDEPREASEDFLRWCRQALKGLQGVVLEDFIQMLLSFPLNPDPMTVEIIQDSIYANSQSLNGRQFADEFIKRRKADAYPHGMGSGANGTSNSNNNSSFSSNQQLSSAHDGSFKVVSKKGKKKGTA
ncbi:hypothetical protein BGZ70_000723 [Mortierella alpina]|uniref:GYF domain-containing protein n=1 Tax=Mortierella alpina TaxID=64518 RepID=A0A9P6JBX2_MORAP|nr:hypothetical protein BGZ70_000723 [Mortierella alpina]